MSTKTTFKRIALVAVAALGLGVLSVAPSTAAVSSLTVTAANGTSANSTDGGASDSTTAATISVSALLDNPLTDSITVAFVKKSAPSGAVAVPFAYFVDSTTSAASSTYVDSLTAATPVAAVAAAQQNKIYKASTGDTYTRAIAVDGTAQFRITKGNTSAGYVGAKFAVQLDSQTARKAGTYTYTAIVKSWTLDAAGNPAATTTTQDLSIVVAAAAQDDTTIVPSSTTAYLNLGSSYSTASDSTVALVSTASSADQAVIYVTTKNANGTATPESITVTVTGPGVVGLSGGAYGKSVVIAGTGTTTIGVRADGTAGTSSIVVKTTTQTFPAKTVTYYAKSAKTITLAVNKPVIGVSATAVADTIRATATDADGNVWGGQAYIVAATAADALIAGSSTPVACTFNSVKGYHECPVAGTAKGTANFNVIDASTVALATATSAATAAVRVSTGIATTAKIAFDKATYGPGEKALVTVTVLDADGLTLPSGTITNAFTADIASTIAFSSGSLSGSASPAMAASTSSSTPSTAGAATYVVYMPIGTAAVTLSATGSTGLAAAGRVAVTATASVVNSSVDAATDAANEATDAANAATDAALAAADAADAATAAAQDASDAVAALSATVAKLVASLKAQITSLTNLVIKIQKKVKA
jgi:hypothetical protein